MNPRSLRAGTSIAPSLAAVFLTPIVTCGLKCLPAAIVTKLRRRIDPCELAQAFIPPSTVRFAPVMYEDSGLATKATIAAISSGRP
jgi:hypothetical protein